RQQVAGTKAAPEPGSQPRVKRRSSPLDRMTVLGEEFLPNLDVAFLDSGELDVDVFAVGVVLLAGEGEIEVGRVGLVLPVMEPLVDVGLSGLGGLLHAARYYGAII